ncbi:MAG: DUF1028 domain-containing protein [Chitinophagales bacterium]|nr:DUF1028 domain-containing protein [Chitinophagales bacterium]
MRSLTIITFVLLVTLEVKAQHTFSIVAVDPVTGQIGSAGASCIDASSGIPEGVAIISGIIPGHGAINAQATICIPHNNLLVGLNHMSNGLAPQEILDTLFKADACIFGDKHTRQYGIVDLDSLGAPRSAAFTGNNAMSYKGHLSGSNYAIQGNILLGPEVLDSMESRFIRAKGGLAYQLMAALQGANIPGADSRCLAEGVSSLSSYIKVSKPDDHPDSLWIDLIVNETPFAKEPIDSLQVLFDNLDVPFDSSNTTAVYSIPGNTIANVFPNPSNSRLVFQINKAAYMNLRLEIFNSVGIRVMTENILGDTEIELNKTGIYLYMIRSEYEIIQAGKVLIN